MVHRSYNMSPRAHDLIEDGCHRLEVHIGNVAARIALAEKADTGITPDVLLRHVRQACAEVLEDKQACRAFFKEDVTVEERIDIPFDHDALDAIYDEAVLKLQETICAGAFAIAEKNAAEGDRPLVHTEDVLQTLDEMEFPGTQTESLPAEGSGQVL